VQGLFKFLFLVVVSVIVVLVGSVTVIIAATLGVLHVIWSKLGLDFLGFESRWRPTSKADRFAARTPALDANDKGQRTGEDATFRPQHRTGENPPCGPVALLRAMRRPVGHDWCGSGFLS
jgi:hypothetical protein